MLIRVALTRCGPSAESKVLVPTCRTSCIAGRTRVGERTRRRTNAVSAGSSSTDGVHTGVPAVVGPMNVVSLTESVPVKYGRGFSQ